MRVASLRTLVLLLTLGLLAAPGVLSTAAALGDEAPLESGAPASHVAGELVVGFAAPPTSAMLEATAATLGDVDWRRLRHAPSRRGATGTPHPLARFRVVRLGSDADVLDVARHLRRVPGVVHVSPHVALSPTFVPDDPRLDEQWSHEATRTIEAWDVTLGSHDVIVASIDTGARKTHEDLAPNAWRNEDEIPGNGVDDDGNGFVDDVVGWDFSRDVNDVVDQNQHGTPVEGIIAGRIDNAVGIAGMANVRVMTSKWLHVVGSDATVAEAVSYAVDNGARVLNLSLGCGCLTPLTEQAVLYAHELGVVVVCAAGNGGSPVPQYPAAYETTIAVSAIDVDGERPIFSSYGEHVDVCAPSPGILSCSPLADDGYVPFGGTSASAPCVTGLVGLMLSVDPGLGVDEVRTILRETAQDVGEPGFDVLFGHGRIDAAAAVAAVAAACPADLDGDAEVGFDDVVTLLAAWGPCGGACPADLDDDGVVGFEDLLAMLAEWGPCGG